MVGGGRMKAALKSAGGASGAGAKAARSGATATVAGAALEGVLKA